MPYREPDPDDPLELRGVALPDPGGEALADMAHAFAEEFLRMGYEPGRVLALFEHPRYVLPHRAYLTLGSQTIRRIIEETARVFAPARIPRA